MVGCVLLLWISCGVAACWFSRRPVTRSVELKRLCSLLVLGLGVGVLMGWDVIWHPAFFRVL